MLVRVLGSAGVDPADEDGVYLRRMERTLLAALAVRRPLPVTIDSLTEALWPDGQPASARKTIQNNVLRLRRKLGRTVIETAGDGYRLADHVDVDIDRFERAMRHVDTTKGPRPWDVILASCPPAPLEQLRNWRPADARRTQLEELLSSAVEARWEAALQRGPPEDLVPSLEAIVAEAPLRERRWSLLLAAYQQAGRRAEGVRAFERARRLLAMEIGVTPGLELVEAYEALLRDEPVRFGAPATTLERRPDLRSLSDQHWAAAISAIGRSDPGAALQSFTEAASLAREAGDPRRFAEAVLAASGDGWRTGFDATADVTMMLAEALDVVAPAPTPLRSRLLARSAVLRSHHVPVSECEAQARRALGIARAIDDPRALAAALHALTVVMWDPYRRNTQRAWLDELIDLAENHPDEPWRRWALPILARVRVIEGDVVGGGEALEQLARDATECGDVGAAYAASHVVLLRATVAGDWTAARAAASAIRAAAEASQLDPAAAALQQMGILGIVDLLAGPTDVAPLAPIEWPLPALEIAVAAWHANCQARAGRIDAAIAELSRIDPVTVAQIEHDAYWLATLSMLADAAYLARFASMAEAVAACLAPVTELTIIDPGLIYRGAAAHWAGLAAVTCGRTNDAVDLLELGLATHEKHGSLWMAKRSEQVLATLAADSTPAPGPAALP